MPDTVSCNLVKKGLVAVTAVFMISGCAIFGDGYEVKINKEEQETEYSSVYAEIIEFDGFGNKEYESELNMKVCDDVNSSISEFDSLAAEKIANLPEGVRSVLKITQNVKRNSGDIISFVSEEYVYTGGAHGMVMRYPTTVDVTSEKPHNLSLGELFCDSDYIKKLNLKLSETVKENPDLYDELWEQPEINDKSGAEFYLTDTDLVLYFPPYELSYYAKGFVEFPIPLEELNPILNERYRVKNG